MSVTTGRINHVISHVGVDKCQEYLLTFIFSNLTNAILNYSISFCSHGFSQANIRKCVGPPDFTLKSHLVA